MNKTQKTVAGSAVVLFVIWLASNWSWIEADEDSLIRFVLGILLSVLILLRPKVGGPYYLAKPFLLGAAGGLGAASALAGIIFNVNQFEWLGVMLVIYACLRWALPPRYGRDILLALVLFYWIHPLPGQVFGALQIRMQIFSVNGAEWLLHMLNREAWADKIMLWTSARAFEVPEVCSGMTTGITVLLCSLGTAILLRFRWFEVLALVGLGLIQVVVLNVIRIAHMVVASEGMPREWSENFLHDTLGAYLLVSIILIQVEAALWRGRRVKQIRKEQGIAAGEVEKDEKATVLPLFWRILVTWGMVIVLVLVLGLMLGAALAIYKRRPYHRAQMIARTASGLFVTAPERARAAALEVLRLDPDNHGVRTDLAKGFLHAEQYENALRELEMIPELDRGPEREMLRIWALFRSGDVPAARALLDALPVENAESPGADLIRAEIAMGEDDPEEVGLHVRGAARLRQLIPRIRGMYPYLAAHEQWAAISDTDRRLPYPSVEIAHIAVSAHLRMFEAERAAVSLSVALEDWPDEPRFMASVVTLARLRPNSVWVDRFAHILEHNLTDLSPHRLAGHLFDCYEVSLPALAWRVHRRLAALVPGDPALNFAVAHYGDAWLTIRSKDVPAHDVTKSVDVDMFPIARLSPGVPVFATLWDAVPMVQELRPVDRTAVKASALAGCLATLREMKLTRPLSGREMLLMADAQALAGMTEEAHRTLGEIAETYPSMRGETVVREAELYNEEQRWHESYEILRDFESTVERTPMVVSMLKANALLRMGFGALTLKTLQEAAERYPGSPQVNAMRVAFWDHVGDDEHALFILRRSGVEYEKSLRARLYHDTGRFREAQDIAARLGVSGLPVPRESDQRVNPVPAEWVVTRRWEPPLTAEQTADALAVVDDIAKTGASAFVRNIAKLEGAWLRAGGVGVVSDVSAWTRDCRDDDERGAALYKLLTLLAQYREYERADKVAEEMVKYWPRSVPLWRAWIALSEGRRTIIDRAVAAAPEDPMVWLADIVRGVEEKRTEAWIDDRVEHAVSAGIPASVILRGADLIFRRGLHDVAARAIHRVEELDSGHLATHTTAIRCALAIGDRDWAIEASRRGRDVAIEPWPYHATLVELTFAQGALDPDTIKALEYLRDHFAEDLKWARMLGDAYFRQGDMKRALDILKPTIPGTTGRMSPHSLLQAAEAARQAGKSAESLEILRQADAIFPEDTRVLNNLIYTMTEFPAMVPEARDLLETRLLKAGEPGFAVLDTAGLVYLRVGDIDKARDYVVSALELIDDKSPAWPETSLNLAEIHFVAGNLVSARSTIEAARSVTPRPDVVNRRSLALLRKVIREEARREKERKAAEAK